MSTPAASACARMRSWISSLALMLNRLVPMQPMVTLGVTRAARVAEPMWEHPRNRYADASVFQEAELSQAQDSPPGRQRQPAAARPAAGQERRVAYGQSAFRQLPREPQADPDRAAFRALAYRLADGAPAAAWWR